MKKCLKKMVSLIVAFSTILTTMLVGTGSTLLSSAGNTSTVLFSSSFENGDGNNFIASTVDNNRISNVIGSNETTLLGDVTSEVDFTSLTGSPDNNNSEVMTNLFDHNTNTKWLTGSPSSSTIYVQFKLSQAETITTYAICSANDSSDRDPKNWTLYGSNDGSNWSSLNSQSDQSFTYRYQQNIYKFSNTNSYIYYKLSITANNGSNSMTQFSELQLGTGSSTSNVVNPMITQISSGPSSVLCNQAYMGWNGPKALMVTGIHEGSGRAYSYNTIYDNLNIPVTSTTQLNYMIFPACPNGIDNYDYNYTSTYVSVDLEFSDGTYLSNLDVADQNGNVVSPTAQGKSNCLYMQQWNNIYSTIGDVANGKTITKILIGYDKPSNSSGGNLTFLDYLDDVKIQNVAPVTHDHLSDWVDTRRGTNNSNSFSRGLITPFVTTPHGFNQFVPVTNDNSSQPYIYQLNGNQNSMSEMEIDHYPSNWVNQYGTWQFMPNTNIDASTVTSGNQINASARAATFTHENEIAHAHYYSVTFNEGSKASGVKMEVTPTDHAAYTRFTFDSSDTYHNLIFDCDRANGGLTFNNADHSFSAFSDDVSTGSTRMYIYGVFDEAYSSTAVVNQKQGIISFPTGTNVVTMKVTTSFISLDQAKKNLQLEISSADTFDTIYAQTQATWDSLLGKIEVEGASPDQLTTLYSNMYRLFCYPMLYSENAGTSASPVWEYSSPYSGTTANPVIKTGKLYTVNGFWDTYRTCWAAYALLTPNEDTDLLNGIIQHYKDQNWIPRWVAPGGANSMVGTSSDVIFGDAAAKGIKFDMQDALKASIKNAAVVSINLQQGGRAGLTNSVFQGYTSKGTEWGFSWSMEGYISDYGISQLASALGKTDEAGYYRNRALNYVNLFNKSAGFFMGKNSDGTFPSISSFNPATWWGDYIETNAWVMSFYTPQDFNGLANLYGGKAAAAAKLDGLFNADSSTISGGSIHEMAEAQQLRLGQDQQSNQPSHDLPYVYDYLSQPYKTQSITRDILNRLYVGSSIGQGYVGDEDNGEMSGWYIFSALGLYPSNMGSGQFAITSPLFTKATIHLENGKDIVINAENNSSTNKYIQSVSLNGTAYDKTYFNNFDLANGATIDFVMGSTASTWGTADDDSPTSLTTGTSVADPDKDFTSSSDTVSTSAPTESVTKDTVYATNTSAAKYLFDNTSASFATLGGNTNSIYFSSAKPKTVSMYTLTSGTNSSTAPSSFTLYGSNDGTHWVQLDSRSNETFDWAQYTRPFAVSSAKQGAYTHYRLDVSGTSGSETLSEVELLGPDTNTSKPQYIISASTGNGGSVSPSGDTAVTSGDSKTFTFTPDSGYQLNAVTVDGSPVSVTGNSYTLTNITAGHTISATFNLVTTSGKPSSSASSKPATSTETTTSSISSSTSNPYTGGNDNTAAVLLLALISSAAVSLGWKRKRKM